MKNLAERLIQARTHREMSQQELANRAGVSQGTIGNLEAGLRLTSRSISLIAKALDVEVLWLAEGVGPMNRDQIENSDGVDDLACLVMLYCQSTDAGRQRIITYAQQTEKLTGFLRKVDGDNTPSPRLQSQSATTHLAPQLADA
jgi:transcriptional regulator with XRE-family HTH domain